MSGVTLSGGEMPIVTRTPKHTSVLTYRISTGFRSNDGLPAISRKQDRIEELAEWCIQQVEAGRYEA